MTVGLAGAFAASAAYGGGTALQSVGARRMQRSAGPDVGLLMALLRSAPYVLGLVLDTVGFLLSVAALRSQPLFVVQAIVASSLVVTAAISALALHSPPTRVEWSAIAVATLGLVLLALSATSQTPTSVDYASRFSVFVGVLGLGAVSAFVARRTTGARPREVWLLGGLAGLMFGLAAIGARVLAHHHHVWALAGDPAAWALAAAGVLGLLLYAMALQRGTVTVATASVVAAETVVPALIGVLALGDRTTHARAPTAVAGFVLTVLGSLALARYGEPLAGDTTQDGAAMLGAQAGTSAT